MQASKVNRSSYRDSLSAKWTSPDILIVDSKNDLNVYFTAAESGQYCCGTEVARDDEQKKEQMLSFCNTEEEQTCCQPGDQRQNDTGSMANEAKSLAAGLGVTEFNEWAGKQE